MFRGSTLPVLIWLIIPVFFILAQTGIELSFTPPELARLHSENGPHEILQVVFSAMAFLLSLRMLAGLDWQHQKIAGVTILLAALGTFYITGEELSWGQQILHWNTPEYWGAINDQDETNLHNTSSWLDQKPRLLLFIGIVIGGLIIPALRRWKPSALPVQYTVLYPSNAVIPAAIGVLLPYAAQELAEHIFGTKIFHRVSEVQELYMYYFIWLYLLDLRKRLNF